MKNNYYKQSLEKKVQQNFFFVNELCKASEAVRKAPSVFVI